MFATGGASLTNVSVTSGGTGVAAEGNPDVTIVHSKISARRGVVTDSFGVGLADTMIDVLTGSGFGAAGGLLTNNTSAALPLTITARHVSIVGTAAGSIGVDVEALVAGQTASASITDTVIHGPATALKRSAVANSTANLTTSYDAYAAGNYTGIGTGATTQLTPPVTGDPGFDAPADPHVGEGSPLIDAESPGGLSAGEPTTDLDGNPRILDGNHDCVFRRDIGAYEFVNSPTVHASAGATTAQPGQRVTFRASGCSIDPASSVTFSWRFDDGVSATGVSVSHAFARTGVHRATVTIRDAAGRISATSVGVTIAVPPDSQADTPEGQAGALSRRQAPPQALQARDDDRLHGLARRDNDVHRDPEGARRGQGQALRRATAPPRQARKEAQAVHAHPHARDVHPSRQGRGQHCEVERHVQATGAQGREIHAWRGADARRQKEPRSERRLHDPRLRPASYSSRRARCSSPSRSRSAS